jgi:hypothetical protein
MSYYGSSEEHQPVTWWRGHPIFAAHFVVVVLVGTMLVTTGLMFSRFDAAVTNWIAFQSNLVLSGQVWRVLTYGLWNPPSLWFAVDMLMIVWFGRELEKFFGRRKFLGLYASVYLLTPVLFTALGKWLPTSLLGQTGAFAIFIAFATLYPNVPIFFTLLAKWIAIVLVGIYTLIALGDRNWTMLLSLWATTAFAFAFVKFQQGYLTLPRMRLPRRKPKLKVIRGEATTFSTPVVATSTSETDALLDKIAQSGFASLTAKERAKLEAARQELKKRSGG